MRTSLLLIPFAVALLLACNNDLDINAEYEDRTIVYGLLNQRDSVHLVKINKAFLGEGNAFDMATVPDSNEYGDESITYAMVFRLNDSGNAIDSFPLRDTLVTNREPGSFNAPVQKLYYFTTPFVQQLNAGRMFLQQDQSYRIRLVVKGREITATTPITNDFTISAVDQDTGGTFASRVGLVNSAGEFSNYEFNWASRRDDKRFVVQFRFRYDEVYGTDTVKMEYNQNMGSRVAANSTVFEDLFVTLNGQAFFSGLSGFVRSNPNWAAADKRIFRGMDFLVSVANDDFHTYLTLTEPVTGIIEDRPVYSNIDGALGVWGSRYTKNVIGKRLNGNSLEELANGTYTSDLRFCSALDPGGAFSCN
ncbi:MAG: DUF4249 family protein [Flavobacteriales bacterium]|nr:DUF4249 family protein [Flavobacteriales bacterium]